MARIRGVDRAQRIPVSVGVAARLILAAATLARDEPARRREQGFDSSSINGDDSNKLEEVSKQLLA